MSAEMPNSVQLCRLRPPFPRTAYESCAAQRPRKRFCTRRNRLRPNKNQNQKPWGAHQQRFKLDVMRAYRHRCAICTLRERALVQAAHIVPDVEPEGIAAVVNGLALCAIHHLAFDRNLLGIDPTGVVHIAERLLREIDGPMLRTGLQGFHHSRIALPRRPQDRPDTERLSARFDRFLRAAT
jgi:predicted restriction endonuclease